MLCLEDAPTADIIEILRKAGIDDDADLGESQSKGATHTVPDLPPQSPLTETEDETSGVISEEATQKDASASRKSKRIHWDESIDSIEGPISTPDDDEFEEEVNEEYLDSLYNAHVRLQRIRRSTPAFSMHLVPVAPSEVDQFFDNFHDKPFAQRQQEFKALRDIHREYVIDLESGKGQPEPKVMPIPHSLVAGAQGSSSSSSGARWRDIVSDGRSLHGRSQRGNPHRPASSRSTIELQPNREASIAFDDQTTDHKWLMVPALNNPINELDIQIANTAYQTATSSPMQDTYGTIPFTDFMSQYEPFLEQHMGDQYSKVSWRERWKQIIQGGHSICFKFVWLHSQYEQCKSYWPFTEDWWQHVATPLRLKFIGSSTQNIASGARGGQLPSNFTTTLVHYTLQHHLPSITRWGLLCGRKCGKSSESCIYLAACDYDAEAYTAATRKLNEGELMLPHIVGFPPKDTHDVRIYVNYARLFITFPGPNLRQAENFAISCASSFAIPWNCLEAAVSLKDNALLWVNPDFFAAYLTRHRDPPPGATRITPQGWSWEGPARTERQRKNEQIGARVDQLLLDKFRGANVALCPRCVIKQQVGTIWCYDCARPMISKQPLPISHDMIKALVCLQAPDRPTDLSGNAPNVPITVGNLTWEQRMLSWRKATFKKKDQWGNHIYHYTQWPISERWKWDEQFKGSCNRMSQQYFQRDFSWEMAQEADCIAWRLWRAEQAAQKGKGKGKGQPEVNATIPQTFEV